MSMKRYIDGGEGLLAACRSLGIDYIFSSPGSEWAPVWEALARQKSDSAQGPVYLDLWHETVAVGMACGYALVTGRVQAVLLHAGPGLLQGTCAIHGALLSGVPMIVFSSESITYGERAGVDPGSQWYRNLSIVGGPHGLVQPIVKWSNQAPSIETLYEMVVRTGEMALRAPAGPTYLNVPVEVLLEPWAAPKFPKRAAPPGAKISPVSEIEAIARLLASAKAPLVLTESAGRDPAAFAALVALCDLLAIAVIEPQSAVSTNFPRDNPLHQGGAVEPLAAHTDLVLLVNCRAPWYPPSARPPTATTIVIDEVPQRPHIVYQVLHADAYLEGDVAVSLQGLAAAVKSIGFDAEQVAARRATLEAAHLELASRMNQSEAAAAQSAGPIDAVHLVKCLRELAGSSALFVDETITHSRLVQQHLRLNDPNRYFYVQGGLGQGLAVALGVKLAARQSPVILLVGDGSFLYNPIVQALAAARDNDLPILVVIFNNQKYLSMQYNHLRFYPDGVAVGTGDFRGVSLATQPDLAAFGQPFDMFGVTVSKISQLKPALAEALATVNAGTCAIVNVMVAK
jgi:thiamine pyrophosphate-dependent acetolactate synthase large subunit-like protein